MPNQILGLHHVTAIANNAQRNYNFYTKILGLRLVKKTVNFDDPGTYHFYFGNEEGTPGTLLTFFPWEGIGRGHNGSGMATEIAYAVPGSSLEFWRERFDLFKIRYEAPVERFGEMYLPFSDPDGLRLTMVIPREEDNRKPWTTAGIKEDTAIRGFHNVTLTLGELEPTAKILTDILGYKQLEQEKDRYRFATDTTPAASIVDIQLEKSRGYHAAGTIHHIAFCVENETAQMYFREKVMQAGLMPTQKINRDYFYSIYFREPGGVLFEIATKNPGFTKDEPLEDLGSGLMLPDQFALERSKIEKRLPKLKTI